MLAQRIVAKFKKVSGDEWEYTGNFSSFPKERQDVVLSVTDLSSDDIVLAYYENEKKWLTIGTSVVCFPNPECQKINVSQIVDCAPCFHSGEGLGRSAKKTINQVALQTMDKEYILHVESGGAWCGICNVLKMIASDRKKGGEIGGRES